MSQVANEIEETVLSVGFVVTGGFDLSSALKNTAEFSGLRGGAPATYEVALTDGRLARLVVALEVEGDNGNVEYVTSESRMEELGFTSLSYNETDFYVQSEGFDEKE